MLSNLAWNGLAENTWNPGSDWLDLHPLIKIINKSLYLSVNVFSTAVLIEDTVNSETNIINQTETC